MEVLGYICGRQVHELEPLVSEAGTVAVVQVVGVDLSVPLALGRVQHVVHAHTTEEILVFRCDTEIVMLV